MKNSKKYFYRKLGHSEIYQIGQFVKTNPIQTQTNPISDKTTRLQDAQEKRDGRSSKIEN
jgi:hypothetical protein